MLFRILKEDLKRKRTMNFIVFLFISIAVMFLASSVTDMKVIFRGVDYYMDKSNVPDYIALQNGTLYKAEIDKISDWLEDSSLVEDFTVVDTFLTDSDSMVIQKSEQNINYNQTSSSVLQILPETYTKVFDEAGNTFTVSPGEIAIPMIDKDKNDIKIGDTLSVKVGTITKEFTVTHFVKDAVCATSYMGIKRFFISESDYEELRSQESYFTETWYMVKTNHVEDFQKSIKSQNFNLAFSFNRSTVKLCFMTDMLIAGILLIVSACLILISFFVLRFTIIFTIQEDYKEIGVMKAIGVKNFGIKSIYLIKYLGLATAAAILGFAASFPFSTLLIHQVSGYILMEDTSQNPFLNLGCSILVVLLVILFCYTSMKKLDKYSAIEAIRSGSTGERFTRKSILQLKRRKRMKTPMFIAITDILTSLRKYLVMIITFCLGTMLIIIPVNSMNTLKDGNLIRMFGINKSDFYISNVFGSNIICEGGKEKALGIMEQMSEEMENAGIPAKLYVETQFSFNMRGEDKEDVYSLITLQNLNGDVEDDDYLEGSKPVLENEIALSEVSAKNMKVIVGDSVYVEMEDNEKEFILTGIYQSMSNQGQEARLNNIIEINYKFLSGVGYLQGDFTKTGIDAEEGRQILSNLYKDKEVINMKQYVSEQVGGIVEQIDTFKNLIVVLVLCINGLITILMIKSFVTKETAEMAMLKSIGFRNKSLRSIYIFRICIVQVVSILTGILLSILLDDYTIGNVFKFMGARHIKLTIVPQEVYVLYPILLFTVPMIVSFFTSFMVGKIKIREMNGEE